MSKLPENCPICGEKMEKGYVHSSLAPCVFWLKKKHKYHTPLDSEILVGKRVRFDALNVEAYRCPNCKIVLFSYGEEKK